jgi:predicted nucleic acid-binding protein
VRRGGAGARPGPRRVFVDTGAWFALQVPDDEWHGEAVQAMRALLGGPYALITTNHVIGETYTLLRVVRHHSAAVRFLDQLEETRRLERIFVSRETEARAFRLLRQHADQNFSFVDATSFAVMRLERIRHAFAFDHHFSTASFLRVPGDVPVEQV